MSEEFEASRKRGINFIAQFLEILINQVENVGNFFGPESQLVYNQNTYVNGNDDIGKSLQEIGFETFDLHSYSISVAPQKSLIVVIDGSFTFSKNKITKRVVQNFFLPEGRYVSNLVLTIVDDSLLFGEEESIEVQLGTGQVNKNQDNDKSVDNNAVNSDKENSGQNQEDIVSQVMDTTKDMVDVEKINTNVKVEEKENKKFAKKNQVKKKGKDVQSDSILKSGNNDEKNKNSISKSDGVTDDKKIELKKEKVESKTDGAVFSYAAMLKKSQVNPVASARKSNKSDQISNDDSTPSVDKTQKKETKKDRQKNRGGPKVNPGCALFVKEIEKEWTGQQFTDCFSKFGIVSSVEIPDGRAFAFVNFESPEALQKCIKAKPIKIEGKEVIVEERTSSILKKKSSSKSANFGNRRNSNNNKNDKDGKVEKKSSSSRRREGSNGTAKGGK